MCAFPIFFFFSSRRRHTRFKCDWSSDVCSSDLLVLDDGRQSAVYLKRHYRLPRWRGLLAALWPGGCWSPALQERQRLAWAAAQGVPVPAVGGACEVPAPGGRLPGGPALHGLSGMIAPPQADPLGGP